MVLVFDLTLGVFCLFLVGSQVRVVTLEMLIILLKELVMHTVENERYSYLKDRHLAMIEVYTVGDSLVSCGDYIGLFYSLRIQTYFRLWFLSTEK